MVTPQIADIPKASGWAHFRWVA